MERSIQQILLQIQLEDVQELLRTETSAPVSGQDFALALKTYQAEIFSCLSVISDQDVAEELNSTVSADQDAIRGALDEEIRARDDQVTARTLAGTSANSSAVLGATSVIEEIESILDSLSRYKLQDAPTVPTVLTCGDALIPKTQHHGGDSTQEVNQTATSSEAEPSSSKALAKSKKKPTHETCLACDEIIPTFDVVYTPCGHIYCRACILRLFKQATVDRELFPPRCCRQRIELGMIRHMVTREFIQTFEAKEEEFTAENPLYCHESTCSAFIRPGDIYNDTGKCSVCRAETCVSCRKLKHGGLCEEDDNVKALRTLAVNSGWQTCFRCKHVVELSVGCNHITCRCGTEFCYICARAWKSCDCPQWDEARLLERGQAAARNQAPGTQVNRAAVVRAVNRLRENHDCAHFGWLPRSIITRRCDLCTRTLPWVVACRCGTNMCVNCKNNRLR